MDEDSNIGESDQAVVEDAETIGESSSGDEELIDPFLGNGEDGSDDSAGSTDEVPPDEWMYTTYLDPPEEAGDGGSDGATGGEVPPDGSDTVYVDPIEGYEGGEGEIVVEEGEAPPEETDTVYVDPIDGWVGAGGDGGIIDDPRVYMTGGSGPLPFERGNDVSFEAAHVLMAAVRTEMLADISLGACIA